MTAVVMDGEFKIAQYGQWDHYPEGQGKTVLAFCREWLTDPVKTLQFCSALARLQDVTDEQIEAAKKQAYAACGQEPDGAGFWTMDVSDAFERLSTMVLLSRDVGGKILEAVATGVFSHKSSAYGVNGEWSHVYEDRPHTYLVTRDPSFFQDGLFCEWGYVVDLDGGFLEVYRGGSKASPKPGERFHGLPSETEGPYAGKYGPVALVAKFSLDDLPTQDVFEKTIKVALGVGVDDEDEE